jgi:hypothetical protein
MIAAPPEQKTCGDCTLCCEVMAIEELSKPASVWCSHCKPGNGCLIYQQVAIEEMERRAFSVQAMHPMEDKRARLRVAARYIKLGIVKFPKVGCEQLLTQLVGLAGKSTTTRWTHSCI